MPDSTQAWVHRRKTHQKVRPKQEIPPKPAFCPNWDFGRGGCALGIDWSLFNMRIGPNWYFIAPQSQLALARPPHIFIGTVWIVESSSLFSREPRVPAVFKATHCAGIVKTYTWSPKFILNIKHPLVMAFLRAPKILATTCFGSKTQHSPNRTLQGVDRTKFDLWERVMTGGTNFTWSILKQLAKLH